MSLWSRITNVFRNDRLTGDIDEELQSHITEAIKCGRVPEEAFKAFGSPLRQRERSRDLKLIPWLDSLRADAVFGWRQLLKNKVTTASAVLSLALAIGACTAAFRLIDALLLRPLPVSHPEQLYALSRHGIGFDGKAASFDGWAYPAFAQMRDAVKDQAELIALGYSERSDLSFGSDQEIEKAQLEYVSGSMFPSFKLLPAAGRLFTEDDDRKPGAHAYAVISHDFWTRRFGQDRKVIGATFHLGNTVFEIIGVGPEHFTGTETGLATEIFVPAMMHPSVTRNDTTWHRTLARIKPGFDIDPIRAKLQATFLAIEQERAKGFSGMSKEVIARFLDQQLRLEPAASGSSDLQREYRTSLLALGVLVVLVLLIACGNVANLMTVQAASRAREMALRVSIGAGRWRLIQLVLVESAWISILAVMLGGAFAWWSAPFVVSMINPPDNPARLSLPWDWRVFGFGLSLTVIVTILFGLTPALRASSIQPSSALKGGEDPHRRRRWTHALIGVQVALCFIVLFVAGLLSASFIRLSAKPTGFSTERLLTLDTVSHAAQKPAAWNEVAGHLRAVPGVERVSMMSWPLLFGYAWNSFVSINGKPPTETLAYQLSVSPGWLDTMKIRLLDGRDLHPNDVFGEAALVNEAFARQFFEGRNPVGSSFARTSSRSQESVKIRIVGLVSDAAYRRLREPILPVAYLPFPDNTFDRRTLVVRTTMANSAGLASTLRAELRRSRPDFHISTIRTQEEINQAQTIRERLMAMLALFFAIVALLLAGIGLYGVLDYSVLQRRREFGIRIAIGAPMFHIARLVSLEVLSVVVIGAVAGLALGMASARYIEALFYEVHANDLTMLATPSLIILAVALLAALRPIVHALRIDPVKMLRSE